MPNTDTHATLDRLRCLLLGLVAFGFVGTAAELWLLGHHEDIWQWVPLVLAGLALAVLGWHASAATRVTLAILRGTMTLAAISGLVGTVQHYRGNVEFERELSPGVSGFALFAEAMHGATPALAPGTMTLLGLLGLAATFRQTLSARQTPSD